MEFLSRMFHGMVHRLLPSRQAHTSPEISRMDAYLNAIYKVLIWDKPKLSCMTLGALLVLFWLIVQLELRFYGVVSILILMMLLCDWYFEQNQLKIEHDNASDTFKQVANVCRAVTASLKAIRKENPIAFCILMCGLFLGLTIIARHVSGLALMYLILVGLFSGPFLISKIPQEHMLNLKKFVQTLGTTEGELAESELIPFLMNRDLNERDPDQDSLLTDKTADSVTNSFISGITSMPSHLDGEGGSLDGLEEEDLEFTTRSTQASAVSYTPGECSSDSDSEHKKVNRDLIDDAASNAQTRTEATDSGSGILGNLTTLGSHLISNVLKPTASAAPKRKDSDSDFEIIDSKEIDESSS